MGEEICGPVKTLGLLPEQKTLCVFDVILAFIINFVIRNALPSLSGGSHGTRMRFILNGQWTCGVNVFALVSIVSVVAGAAFSVLLLKQLGVLLCTFLGTTGETV